MSPQPVPLSSLLPQLFALNPLYLLSPRPPPLLSPPSQLSCLSSAPLLPLHSLFSSLIDPVICRHSALHIATARILSPLKIFVLLQVGHDTFSGGEEGWGEKRGEDRRGTKRGGDRGTDRGRMFRCENKANSIIWVNVKQGKKDMFI